MVVASIPCGLMSEVLLATQEPLSDVKLYAIDSDRDNFKLIRDKYVDRLNEKKYKLSEVLKNALDIDYVNKYKESFDVIFSIDLTIGLDKDDDVQRLFNGFYTALKKNGKLVTNYASDPSEYTNSEALSKESTYLQIRAILMLHENCENIHYDYCHLLSFLLIACLVQSV